MSPIRVTFRRTIGMARTLYTAMLALAGFLAATAALLAFNLDQAEGSRVRFVSLWAVSVAPILPMLSALLGMEVWSDERRSGRIDLLLASPVRERELVLGKFLGVWTMTLIDIVFALVTTYAFVGWFAPRLLVGVSLWSFLPGLFALALQSLLWSAVAVASSAFFRNAAAACCTAVVVITAIPRALWCALMAWAPLGRPRFGEMPLDAQVFDMASGLFSSATILTYLLLTGVTLFLASKVIASLRLDSRGARAIRLSTYLTVLLAVVFTVEAIVLAYRLDVTMDVPVNDVTARFSAKTRHVLSESQGTISITAFLERKDPRFREVSHFLRTLVAEADTQSGVRIDLHYVDPTLDIGPSQRLVRANIENGSLVFESNGRIVGHVSLADGYGERSCMAVIERLSSPVSEQKNCIYWTIGHGEASFADYSQAGLSSIARDLALDGYQNRTIDLAGEDQIPENCALIVIAGARNDFSAVEMNRLRSYLEGRGDRAHGGRLLVMMDAAQTGGLASLLSEWGVRPESANLAGVRRLAGDDVIVTDFSEDHIISAPFVNQQVIFDCPVGFAQTAAASGTGNGADRKHFIELIRAGKSCLAAAVESGTVSTDLAISPTRLVVVGDLGFVLNGQMRDYRNANRDFFLNCVKYLSSRESMTEYEAGAGQLVSGMDRLKRAKFVAVSAVIFPTVLFLVLVYFVSRRRNRR